MEYLLDTTTISDWVKGNTKITSKMLNTSPQVIAVSTMSVYKICFGLEKNPQAKQKYGKLLEDFFNDITVLSFDLPSALEASKIRNQLTQKGTPIGSIDLLIAASARVMNLIVVTSNTKEFNRVENLLVEDWKK